MSTITTPAVHEHKLFIGGAWEPSSTGETFEREKDFSILEQIEAELADVDRALHRLDDGSYGRCDACRQPIDDNRLEAMPAARFCYMHQAQAESRANGYGG